LASEANAPCETKSAEYRRRKLSTVLLTSERALNGLRPYLLEEQSQQVSLFRRRARKEDAPPDGLDLGPPAPAERALLLVHPPLAVPHGRAPVLAAVRIQLEPKLAHRLLEVAVGADEDRRAHLDRRLVLVVVLRGAERPRVDERVVVPGPEHGRPAADVVGRLVHGDVGLEAQVLELGEVREEVGGRRACRKKELASSRGDDAGRTRGGRTSSSCSDDGDPRHALLRPLHTGSTENSRVAGEAERKLVDGPQELRRRVGDEEEEADGGGEAHLGARGWCCASRCRAWQHQLRLLAHERVASEGQKGACPTSSSSSRLRACAVAPLSSLSSLELSHDRADSRE